MGDVRRDVVLGIDTVLRSVDLAEFNATKLRQLLSAQREGYEALAHRVDPATDPLAMVTEFQQQIAGTRTGLAPLRARLNEALDLEGKRVRTPRPTDGESVFHDGPIQRLSSLERSRLATRLAERGCLLAGLPPTTAGQQSKSAIDDDAKSRWSEHLSSLPFQLLVHSQEAAQVGDPTAGRISGIGHALLLLIQDERRWCQNGLKGVAQGRILATTRAVLFAIAAAEAMLRPLQRLLTFLDRVPDAQGESQAVLDTLGSVLFFSLELRRCGLKHNDANLWGSPGRPGSALLAAVMGELTRERAFVRTRDAGPEIVSAGYSTAEATALCGIAEDYENPVPFALKLRRALKRSQKAV